MKSDKFNFIEEVKKFKEKWVLTKGETITPILFLEKEGVIESMIVSPEIDKYAGLWVASISRMILNPDKIYMTVDANMIAHDISDRNLKELEAEMRHYPENYLQLQKAKGQKNIIDVLICIDVNSKGESNTKILPYKIEDKKVTWLNSDLHKMQMDGQLVNSLKETMMRCKPIIDDPEYLSKIFNGNVPDVIKEMFTDKNSNSLKDAMNKLLASQNFVFCNFNGE